eukprot:CAMPEP_0182803234 /NCGR_PEP_ID=MMETSP0006_2-20121128/3911_1 /TAXON_ID=97485 /ORGANISM="Prymnesium parvum, Strain Texoma1" /LENGTH=59 /DNA_ID=CAMNT_0024928677 /DNA_START=1058 /DNA_END=1237 /DNA_ORIENTATION=+
MKEWGGAGRESAGKDVSGATAAAVRLAKPQLSFAVTAPRQDAPTWLLECKRMWTAATCK